MKKVAQLTYNEHNSHIQQSFAVGFGDGVVHKRHELFGNNRLFVDRCPRFLIFLLLLFPPSSEFDRFSVHDSGQVVNAFSKFVVFRIALALFNCVIQRRGKLTVR